MTPPRKRLEKAFHQLAPSMIIIIITQHHCGDVDDGDGDDDDDVQWSVGVFGQ